MGSRSGAACRFGKSTALPHANPTGSGGPLTLAVTTGTPVIQVDNQTATINAALAGTQGLQKTGAGTLTLAGANTYGGATSVIAGAVNVSGDASGSTGGWSLSPGTSVDFLAGSSVSVASGSSLDLLNGTASPKRPHGGL